MLREIMYKTADKTVISFILVHSLTNSLILGKNEGCWMIPIEIHCDMLGCCELMKFIVSSGDIFINDWKVDEVSGEISLDSCIEQGRRSIEVEIINEKSGDNRGCNDLSKPLEIFDKHSFHRVQKC